LSRLSRFNIGVAEIIDPYPVLYIPEIDTVVVSDLHLGYEGVMAEEAGVFIPKVQFEKEMHIIREVTEGLKARRIVLNGDVKHEFSETSYHETRELSELLEYLQNRYGEVILVKGNHDNYIIRVTGRYGVELVEEYQAGRYYFIHGHFIPESFESKGEVVIIGHEHPAVVLYDEIGAREKIPCLLHGHTLDGRKIIVLPPMSIFAQGNEVNIIPKNELLSPILREYVDIDELEVIAVSQEAGCIKFPKLKILRTAAAR